MRNTDSREVIALALIVGFILDQLLGDPHAWPHPVRLIGGLITGAEKCLRKVFPPGKCGERMAGGALVLIVVGAALLVSGAVVLAAGRLPWAGRVIIGGWICYRMLAVRSLKDETLKVSAALERGSLADARSALSMIVGRDTAVLDEKGIIKAAVETVAENASDGCIAPMLYMAAFGIVGICVYKAVNTMDSMVGYKNERYRFFGTVAARLDDLLNFIPSRICALLLIAACGGQEYSRAGAWKIWRRDHARHASPNSAQGESAVAGALGLQLGGDAVYFGKPVHKPTIGDALREPEREDIRRAIRLMERASVAALVLLVLIHFAVAGIM